METEHELRERSAKGERAQRLLDEGLLREAIDGERWAVLDALANAKDDRELIHVQARLLALNALPKRLRHVVDDGKMAKATLVQRLKEWAA